MIYLINIESGEFYIIKFDVGVKFAFISFWKKWAYFNASKLLKFNYSLNLRLEDN